LVTLQFDGSIADLDLFVYGADKKTIVAYSSTAKAPEVATVDITMPLTTDSTYYLKVALFAGGKAFC
jgi:hypothetical protein